MCIGSKPIGHSRLKTKRYISCFQGLVHALSEALTLDNIQHDQPSRADYSPLLAHPPRSAMDYESDGSRGGIERTMQFSDGVWK